MNLIEILSGDYVEAALNLVELTSLALMVKANIKLNKLLGDNQMKKLNKAQIFNTLAFDPKYTGSEEIVGADFRGRVIVSGDEVQEGAEVLNQIPANPDKIYLVSKPVFDFCINKRWLNVAVFDPNKTVYGELPNGSQGAIAQGGLIFGDEI